MQNLIIIEDFDFIRKDFVLKIGDSFEIFEAAETNEARDLIAVHSVEIIVLDSKLNFTNPYDFIDEIKVTRPEIRIIAFLNKSNLEMLKLFNDHGIQEYIFKTDNRTQIIKKLQG